MIRLYLTLKLWENKYINKTKLSKDKRCECQSSIKQTLKDLNIS
jgi:hypothetical protein